MILRLRKAIESRQLRALPPGIGLRTYGNDSDQNCWITIHQTAFGHRKAWSNEHFMREFFHKKWWNAGRMWFAVDLSTNKSVGTVTLGEPGRIVAGVASVNWLAVIPTFRQAGIGTLLMRSLEQEAHELGYQWLELETLTTWHAAIDLYKKLGFRAIPTSAES